MYVSYACLNVGGVGGLYVCRFLYRLDYVEGDFLMPLTKKPS
jgi:hypothetical protein